jgi:transposase
MTEVTAVLYRWVRGDTQRAIARSLDVSRNTVRSLIGYAKKYSLSKGDTDETKLIEISQKISEERIQCCQRNRPTDEKLEPYKAQIEQWLAMPYMTIKQIWRLLQEQSPTIQIGRSSLHRYIKRHFELTPVNSTMVIPTIAGHQAQVDFGYVGLMHCPIAKKNKKAYAFVMTLSHSRHRFVCIVFRQDTVTWVDCHRRAFEFFGGVPHTILLDNLKAGVLKPDIYDPTINRAYAECERHYGFAADPAKVRTPEHKGKVERSITIVKQQVISGREHKDIHSANDYALYWSREVICNEITRTTGETPKARFERDDKPALLPLPDKPFECPAWSEGKVFRDQHVTYRGSFYSLPESAVGKNVLIRATLTTVRFYYKEALIKTHPIATEKGTWRTDIADLSAHAQYYLENTPEVCIKNAEAIGPSTHQVIKATLHRHTNTQQRKAQAILRLAESYGDERLEAACHRALTFDSTEYRTLQNILEQELDKKSSTDSPQYDLAELSEGAFLREPDEFMIH